MTDLLRIACVFNPRMEHNIEILKVIAQFNQVHDKWITFHDDEALAIKDPDWLFSKHWDGIMVKDFAPNLFQKCVSLKIPCIDLSDESEIVQGVPKVRPDNITIGHVGAEYFMGKGYTHFGFCGYNVGRWSGWSNSRGEGFREALELMGHKCDTFKTPFTHNFVPKWMEGEEMQLISWIESLPKPLAIMTCNDLRANQIINACRNANIQIPEEVAVLGVNNDYLRCELSIPQLSSIPLNAKQYGRTAAKMMIDLINGKQPEQKVTLIEPLDVISRPSTDATAIEDKQVASAMHLIRENACLGITVEAICSEIHISRTLIERRFRKVLGKSPHAIIRQFQIRKIKQLLEQTEYKLTQIAELVGIEHAEYLNVLFKRMTKMTPNQYRSKFKGKLV